MLSNFLIKKFIKNNDDINDNKVRIAYGNLGGTVGIIITAMIMPIQPARILWLKNIIVPPIRQMSAQIDKRPPLGTNTSAMIRAAVAKYKNTAKTSHQSIVVSP